MVHSGRPRPCPQTYYHAGKLARDNTLAYYENPYITAIISFMVQAHGGDLIEQFGAILFTLFSKLDRLERPEKIV
jgi:hypothetical protein